MHVSTERLRNKHTILRQLCPRPAPPPSLSLSVCLIALATLQVAAEQGHLQRMAVNLLGCDSAQWVVGGSPCQKALL